MKPRILCLTLVVGSVFTATAVAGPWRKGVRPNPEPTRRPLVFSGGGADGPGFSDNFDSYANGSQIIGQGGWVSWGNLAVPPPYINNNATGLTSNAHASNGANSCRYALANAALVPPTDQTDMVHMFNVNGGQWVYKLKTFISSTSVATTAPYVILLRSYDPTSAGAPQDHWSVQVHWDKLTNLVVDDNWMGGGVTFPVNVFTNQPIVYDQWVEFRCEIDLDVQDGRVKTYYNNILLSDHKWYDTPNTPLAPPYTLQATDLYDDGIDEFFVDDISLAPAAVQVACYPNCDGSTILPCLNVQDFGCFLNKFANNETYANCDGSTIPPVLNVQDFGCYLNKFAIGCSSC